MSAWPQPSFQISTHIKYLPGSIINVSSYIYIQFLDYTPAEQSFRSFSCTVYLCLGPRLSQVSGVWRGKCLRVQKWRLMSDIRLSYTNPRYCIIILRILAQDLILVNARSTIIWRYWYLLISMPPGAKQETTARITAVSISHVTGQQLQY